MVNPLAPDAVPRVQGALDRGMHAVCLFPAMHRYSMHDDAALARIGCGGCHQAVRLWCSSIAVC